MNHVSKAELLFPAHAFPLPETLEEAERLVASIERAVQHETNGGVQDLAVEMDGDNVVLTGRCGSFYCKQLAAARRHGHPRRRPAGQSHRSVLINVRRSGRWKLRRPRAA